MPRRIPLALACCLLAACGGRKEPKSDSQGAGELTIEVADASGLEIGARVTTRGVAVAEVSSVKVDGDHVEILAKLTDGQAPSFGAGSCARVVDGELVLEPGDPDTPAPATFLACAGSDGAQSDEPDPWPGLDARDEEAKPEPVDLDAPGDDRVGPDAKTPPKNPGDNNKPKKKAKARKPKSSDCGDTLSFSTLSVTDVAPQPLHLPDGGWRAKIKWKNTGSGYVDIDPVSRAVFMDKDGAALEVATLPASRDWFMGFSVPPGGSKTVTVTFYDDGGPKPFVEKIRYDYVCG